MVLVDENGLFAQKSSLFVAQSVFVAVVGYLLLPFFGKLLELIRKVLEERIRRQGEHSETDTYTAVQLCGTHSKSGKGAAETDVEFLRMFCHF